MKINGKEALVSAVADASGHPQRVVKEVLEALLTVMRRALSVPGGKVVLKSIGALEVKLAKATRKTNPKTGEPIEIPARQRVRFAAAKGLK